MANRSGRRHLDAQLRRFVRAVSLAVHLLNRWRRLRDAQQRYRNEDTHDPHLKFYTIYDREAKAFDSEYVWACRENLSEVLVVVRRFHPASGWDVDPSIGIGWSVLHRLLKFRARSLVENRTRYRWRDGRPPPSHSLYHQPCFLPRRIRGCSRSMGRPFQDSSDRIQSCVLELVAFDVDFLPCDAREAMARQVHPPS